MTGLGSGLTPCSPPIYAAPANADAPNALHALLILFPGALLYPKDYKHLLAALHTAPATLETQQPLALWVAVASVDWTNPALQTSGRDVGDTAAAAALEAARQAGFPGKATTTGRCDSVFVAMHSISTIFASGFPMRNAGGVIMLGSALLPQDDFSASVYEFPRPMLHVLGSLDGQLSLSKAALIAADAAKTGAALGAAFAARSRPVVIVPGMNHGHFSNGIANTMRGDLEAEISLEAASAAVADAVSRFVLVNHPEYDLGQEQIGMGGGEDVTPASWLAGATASSAAFVDGYLSALGRPSVSDILGGAARPAVVHGVGTEAFPVSYPGTLSWCVQVVKVIFSIITQFTAPTAGRRFIAHPGELAAAEAFCVAAQRAMLRAVMSEEEVTAHVHIVATAHTDLDAFTFGQPLILPDAHDTGERMTQPYQRCLRCV